MVLLSGELGCTIITILNKYKAHTLCSFRLHTSKVHLMAFFRVSTFLRDSGFVQPGSQAGLRKSAQPLTFTVGRYEQPSNYYAVQMAD